jgi:hypothetical protein
MSLRSIKRKLLRIPTHLDSVILLELSFETKVEENGVRELAYNNAESRDGVAGYWRWSCDRSASLVFWRRGSLIS